MSDLVRINSNQVVTDSRSVAEHFGKEHKNVLRAIDDLVAQNSATKNMFYETSHEYRGQSFRYFLMNRDGFSLLVMGFTGEKALEWKLKYINAFNAMEKTIKDKHVKQVESDKTKEMRAEAMLRNSISKQAKMMMEIAKMSHIKMYLDVMMAKAGNILAGENVLPMPKSERERQPLGWFCKQIGKPTTWATQLGKMLKLKGIEKRPGENGEFVEDHAKGNHQKQVQNFEWYVDYLLPIVQRDFVN